MLGNYAWTLVETLSRAKKIREVSPVWAESEKYVETTTKNERENMKFFKTLLVTFVAILILGFIGCTGFQDAFTPCHINPAAIEYSGQPATSYAPWTTVLDAKRIRAYINYNHVQYQNACDRLKKDDKLQHAFLLGGVDHGIADAVQFQKLAFSPTGPLGFLAVAGGSLGIGALAIKRPGDKSKKQIERETNGSTAA